MKCVKLDFKDILFYAPNWSDAKGASYGHFTEFSSPTFEARRKIKVSGNPLSQKKYAYHGQNFRKVHFMTVKAASRLGMAWLIPLDIIHDPVPKLSEYMFNIPDRMYNIPDPLSET